MYTHQIANATGYFEEVADSLTYVGFHDTPVGNLVADAFRVTMGTQIGIEPGGSAAQPIYAGPIVAADLFRTVGYGFNECNALGYRMATFTISGAALSAGLEMIGLSEIEKDDEFFIQTSGLTYTCDAQLPPASRLVNAFVGGVPLDATAEYSVATNEFVPMALSMYGIPFPNLHVYTCNTTEFQGFANYVSQPNAVVPNAGNRIRCDYSSSANPLHNRLLSQLWPRILIKSKSS